MKPINQYATLKEFTDDIDASNARLPFKIMGKKGSHGPYYTGSMLAAVFSQINDPDANPGYHTIQAPFGEILRKGCRLTGGTDTFSRSLLPNPKTGNNLLQADIVELDLSFGGKAFPQNRLALIVTHSCGVDNSNHLNAVPVYLESELTESVVTRLRGGPAKNFAMVRENWLANENASHIGIPAAVVPKLNPNGERMLACLGFSSLCPKKAVPTEPILRLTYRALAYVQGRVALFYLRDVQDSDDTRDI